MISGIKKQTFVNVCFKSQMWPLKGEVKTKQKKLTNKQKNIFAIMCSMCSHESKHDMLINIVFVEK